MCSYLSLCVDMQPNTHTVTHTHTHTHTERERERETDTDKLVQSQLPILCQYFTITLKVNRLFFSINHLPLVLFYRP